MRSQRSTFSRSSSESSNNSRNGLKSWTASRPEMNCCIRSLSPSNAADMLANIVSPPIAGTSLATRIVALGGSLRNVSSECQTSVRNGGLVSSLRNLIRTETSLSLARTDAPLIHRTGCRSRSGFGSRCPGCGRSAARSRPVHVRWRRHLVGHRLTKIDTGDLGPDVSADPRDRDTGMLRHDGAALEAVDGLIHDANLSCGDQANSLAGFGAVQK